MKKWRVFRPVTNRYGWVGVQYQLTSLKKKKKIHSRSVPLRFLQWEIRITIPGESQLRQSRSIQPAVHVGCFTVSIIRQTLTWTTGSLTCAQMLMHAIAHGACTDTERESALKVDSGRKIPCRTGDSNLHQPTACRSDTLLTELLHPRPSLHPHPCEPLLTSSNMPAHSCTTVNIKPRETKQMPGTSPSPRI